ncbi:CoA transferase subunit A [Pseudarthrobacter oxydans]|uniref:3-oxoacid CoA-transferase subunit A n=1 Tax=Pseudarthrobacter oxydans TaxID=1671 RepID=UPI0015749478|nr:CoA transferase subunit A [Pseudarthrobacter oxydans]
MTKLISSARDAVAAITSGSSIAIGGVGLDGVPSALVDALCNSAVEDLEIISNQTAFDDKGFGRLLADGRVRRMVSPYQGRGIAFPRQHLAGLEVELIQQDVLSERLRAGGSGIAAFFTSTGVSARVADGRLPSKHETAGGVAAGRPLKETRTFCGTEYVLERGITVDFALVRAWKGDRHGNLVYREADRAFNSLCALSAGVRIAEVEELVEPDDMQVGPVHTPGILINHVFALAPRSEVR